MTVVLVYVVNHLNDEDNLFFVLLLHRVPPKAFLYDFFLVRLLILLSQPLHFLPCVRFCSVIAHLCVDWNDLFVLLWTWCRGGDGSGCQRGGGTCGMMLSKK